MPHGNGRFSPMLRRSGHGKLARLKEPDETKHVHSSFRFRHVSCCPGNSCRSFRAGAQQEPIKPFKDELFSRMTLLKSLDGGAYEVIDYQEMRDINGRDREPERRVKDEYVSLGVRRYQQNETLNLAGRRIDVTRVGQADGAAFTVIFIHGRGGDRRLGANDYTFGGNFNRLKNLASRQWRHLLFAERRRVRRPMASPISRR
jgi:hypothetical protein